ncbi:hypothetical protein ACFL2V_12545 [Pseudomonadota bacterium]
MNSLPTKLFFSLIVTLGIALGMCNQSAIAHTLKETTSKVVLRDGQVEIQLNTNIDQWIEKLSSNHEWLTGNVDQMIPQNLNEAQTLNFLRDNILSELKLQLNGESVQLTVSHFPDQIHQPKGKSSHGVSIVLHSKHTLTHVKQITIRYPKSLGAVHATIVKPHYRMAAPGKPITISF